MIKDSGDRRTFDTGAVRDMAEGRIICNNPCGRCE